MYDGRARSLQEWVEALHQLAGGQQAVGVCGAKLEYAQITRRCASSHGHGRVGLGYHRAGDLALQLPPAGSANGVTMHQPAVRAGQPQHALW